MQPRQQAEGPCRLEHATRLVLAEDTVLAEHVGEASPAMGGDARQLLVDQVSDVGLDAVGPGPELRRHGVCPEPRRDDVDRPLATEPVRDVDEPQLGLEIEPVAGLRLDRRDPVGEHLVEPASPVLEERGLRCGTRGLDRREDAAAGRQDVEIRRARLAEHQLVLARPGEQQVGVRVDEPGRHGPAGGVDPREAGEGQPVRLDLGLHRDPRPDARDAAFPDRHGRGVGRRAVVRDQPADLTLIGPAPDPAREGDDLARADDEQARCRLPRAAALDDAERPAAHVGRGPSSRAASAPPRTASRRSSRTCIGE